VVKRIDSACFLAGSLLSFLIGSNELRQCTAQLYEKLHLKRLVIGKWS